MINIMLSLIRRLMDSIITLFDNMRCRIGCCSTTINVSVPPPVCSDCSRTTLSDQSESTGLLDLAQLQEKQTG